MRVFSPDEKKILEKLDSLAGTMAEQKKGEIKPVSLYSLVELEMKDAGFVIDTNNSNVVITFESDPKTEVERLGKLQLIIVQSVNLLKLLEDKGYIYTFKKSNPLIIIPFGKYQFIAPSLPYNFTDQRIVDLVIKYSTEEIYPTLELNHFIRSDNFQTREAARFDKSFRRTTVALFVAIIALLSNVGFNIYNSFYKKTESNIQKKIDESNTKENRNFKKDLQSKDDSIKKNKQ